MALTSFGRPARAAVAIALAVAAMALAFTAEPASAGLACPGATAKPFTPWSDYANYAFAPNGGFESTTTGWSLNGARLASGNESFYLHGSADRHSLSLPAGASATSPAMCISLLSGKMRFVARGDTGAKVKVQVIYRGLLSSVLGIFDGGTMSVGGSWQPSPEVNMFGGMLPVLTASVSFRFTATGGAVWLDDVYLDPMKSS